MTEGYSIKLKVTGTKKKAKWYSSNKKVAKVSNKGVAVSYTHLDIWFIIKNEN